MEQIIFIIGGLFILIYGLYLCNTSNSSNSSFRVFQRVLGILNIVMGILILVRGALRS